MCTSVKLSIMIDFGLTSRPTAALGVDWGKLEKKIQPAEKELVAGKNMPYHTYIDPSTSVELFSMYTTIKRYLSKISLIL